MSAAPRGRPRDPEADAAILQAGFEIFCERGVEGTSIEQIAKRAGVGKLTIYRRWTSKEELIAAAIERELEADRSLPGDQEFADQLTAEILEAMVPGAADAATRPEHRAMIARLFGSAVSHPDLFAIYWERYVLPRRQSAAAILRRAQQDGSVSVDSDLDVLLDMMAGAVLYRILQPDPPDAAEMRRYLTAVYRATGLL